MQTSSEKAGVLREYSRGKRSGTEFQAEKERPENLRLCHKELFLASKKLDIS